VIAPSLHPEAFAVFKSAQSQDLTGEARVRFLDDYFRSLHSGISNRWTLREAATLQSGHALVSELASDFAFQALSRHPRTGAPVNPAELVPPSERELGRIQRTLYRFQLYCNLFHTKAEVKAREKEGRKHRSTSTTAWGQWRRDVLSDQCCHFFGKFAVWENEQFASIYEFLYQQISERKN
jgi:hypothetical protein